MARSPFAGGRRLRLRRRRQRSALLSLVMAGERRRWASRSTARLRLRREYPVAARPFFFCQAAIISRERSTEHAIGAAGRESQRRERGLETLAVGRPETKRRLRGFRALGSASSAFCARPLPRPPCCGPLLRLSVCAAAAAAIPAAAWRLASPTARRRRSLLRLRLLAHFFLDLAPQGRFLVRSCDERRLRRAGVPPPRMPPAALGAPLRAAPVPRSWAGAAATAGCADGDGDDGPTDDVAVDARCRG